MQLVPIQYEFSWEKHGDVCWGGQPSTAVWLAAKGLRRRSPQGWGWIFLRLSECCAFLVVAWWRKQAAPPQPHDIVVNGTVQGMQSKSIFVCLKTLGRGMNKKIPVKLFYGSMLGAMSAHSGISGFLVKPCTNCFTARQELSGVNVGWSNNVKWLYSVSRPRASKTGPQFN